MLLQFPLPLLPFFPMRVSLLAAAATALLATTGAVAQLTPAECKFHGMDFSSVRPLNTRVHHPWSLPVPATSCSLKQTAAARLRSHGCASKSRTQVCSTRVAVCLLCYSASSLSGVDYSLPDSVSNGVYHWSVCGKLTTVPACKGLSACVVNATGAFNWGEGLGRGLDWKASNGDAAQGVQYYMEGEFIPIPGSHGDGTNLISAVSFKCAEQQGEWRWDGNGDSYKYAQLDTPLACAPKPIVPPKPTRKHKCSFNGVDYSSALHCMHSVGMPLSGATALALCAHACLICCMVAGA